MDPLEISRLSREYVLVPVTMSTAGGAVDPVAAGYLVEMALLPPDVDPVEGDWAVADWERDAAGVWNARCLVGPGGGVEVPVGVYEPWVRITGNPEVPVRRAPGWVRVS